MLREVSVSHDFMGHLNSAGVARKREEKMLCGRGLYVE